MITAYIPSAPSEINAIIVTVKHNGKNYFFETSADPMRLDIDMSSQNVTHIAMIIYGGSLTEAENAINEINNDDIANIYDAGSNYIITINKDCITGINVEHPC